MAISYVLEPYLDKLLEGKLEFIDSQVYWTQILLAGETYIRKNLVFIIFGTCLTLCIFIFLFLFEDGKFSICDCYGYYRTLTIFC